MRTRAIALLGFMFILAGCKDCCSEGERPDVPDEPPDDTQDEKPRDIHVQWLLANNNDLVHPEFPRFDDHAEMSRAAAIRVLGPGSAGCGSNTVTLQGS